MRRRTLERQPEHLWSEGLRGVIILVLVTAGLSAAALLLAFVLATTVAR